MARPAYLRHIGTRCRGTGRSELTCAVVLRPGGRALLPAPARQRLGLALLAPDVDVELGWVAPDATEPVSRRQRSVPRCWVFTRPDRPAEAPRRRYDHRSEAIESCAVEAIDGPAVRQRFDDRRWQQRRPSDN